MKSDTQMSRSKSIAGRLVLAAALGVVLLANSAVASASPVHAATVHAASAPNSDTGSAGYDEHFFLQSADGNFRLQIGAQLQARYTLRFDDRADGLALSQSRFFIRRARLALVGHAFSKKLGYVFVPRFDLSQAGLLEYFVNDAFIPHVIEGRVGKWRLPFLRQQITSSSRLLLVGRSQVTQVFGQGFDVGAALHNGYTNSPRVEWVAGIFNGTTSSLGVVGVDSTQPPDVFFPTLVGRIAYNYGGIDAYSGGDLEGGPLRFAVGASALAQLGVDRDHQSATEATLDYVIKVRGFSTSGAVMLASKQDGSSLVDQNAFVGGFFAQASYLVGEVIQPALRYSLVDFEGNAGATHEAMGGINVYFYGHNLKWQTDAGAIINQTPHQTATRYRARTQLQLAF